MMPFNAMRLRGGGWTPARLTNPPDIWVNDTSAITDAGSGACSQWNDISGNGYHFTQSAGTSRPLIVSAGVNGLRTVRGDGTADIMLNNSTGARDIFNNQSVGYMFATVKKVGTDGVASSRVVFSFTRGATVGVRAGLFASIGGSVANAPALLARRLDGDSSGTYLYGSGVSGSWHTQLAIFDWSGRQIILYQDGVELGRSTGLWTGGGSTSNTTSLGAVGLFGSYSASGSTAEAWADVELLEAAAGNGTLSAGDIDKIFGYANHRAGLAANLPALHPYKNAPPVN